MSDILSQPTDELFYFSPKPGNVGWRGFGPCPADSPLPPSERSGAPYQLLYQIHSPEPWLCCRAEQLLTPMDFSFVDLTESMFRFCLPRPGPWIRISFHHSSSLVSLGVCVRVNPCVFMSFSFSINFPNPVCSLETTSSVALSSSSFPELHFSSMSVHEVPAVEL